MKRTWLLIALLGLMLWGVWALALAQPPGDPDAAAPGETITGIVEFDGATVYAGPDFAYDPLAQLPINAAVTVLGRRGDFFYAWDGDQWLEILFEGETGWVYARLIRTSIPFNSIPPTGRRLPRNRDGRVPDDFGLSDNICDSWVGEYTRTGDFMAGDTVLTVTYPELPGANVYSVIVISPYGERTAHDSTTTTAEIELKNLNRTGGTYTWRVAPYWTNAPERWNWQQLCLLETGGTFEVPGPVLTPRPTRDPYAYYYYYYDSPSRAQPTPPPLVP
ncbi:MAG: SH3 domain-containing protein [Chloroflexi bacterium]|nr:SH3 domain-containing protein [Chloroflexota bacterium]